MRCFPKTVSVGAEVTSGSRLFQRRLPTAENTQSPTVESCVCRSLFNITVATSYNRHGTGLYQGSITTVSIMITVNDPITLVINCIPVV